VAGVSYAPLSSAPLVDQVSFRSVLYMMFDMMCKVLVNDMYRSAVCWIFGEPHVYTFDGL